MAESLGKIGVGKNLYHYFCVFKDKTTGQFAKEGERIFDFVKLKKGPDFATNKAYELVKHADMSPLGVRTGRTISKFLYYAKKPPVKAGLIAGAALTGLAGYGIYKLFEDKKENQLVDVNFEELQQQLIDLQKADVTQKDKMYIVKDGDNIWDINKTRLKENNRKVTNGKLDTLTNETVKINPGLEDNGNLIFDGDTLNMPELDIVQ